MSLSKSTALKVSAAIAGSALLGYSLYRFLRKEKNTSFVDKHHKQLFELTKDENVMRAAALSNVQYKLVLAFLPNSETYEGYVEIFFELKEKQ